MSNDVLYAMTEDGVNLPVIDVTNPAFAVTATDEDLAAMSEQYVRESAQMREIPAALREALQQSTLGRAVMGACGTYLAGLDTYRMKLGPDNLGVDAHPIDRLIAQSFPAFTARLRLQDMARLLADGLMLNAAAGRDRPVCLINIGGGPASDSWNALIYLHSERPELLIGRKIVIAVLDLDARGPAFGFRALNTLRAPAAPLGGLDIGLRHFTYDWSEDDRLRGALQDLGATGAACAVSSEGGLFEYGSDEEIAAHLRTIRAGTAPDAFVVGSVTRDGAPARASLSASGVSTRPRTREAFRVLAEQAGWSVQYVIERPFSYHVWLGSAAGRGQAWTG